MYRNAFQDGLDGADACMDTSRCLFSGVAASWTRVGGRYVRVGSQVQRSVSSSWDWEDERKRKPPFLKDTPSPDPYYPWQVRGSDGFTGSRHLPAPASRLGEGEGGQDMLSPLSLPSLCLLFPPNRIPRRRSSIFFFFFFSSSGDWRFFLFPPAPSSLAIPGCYFVLRSLLL